MLHHSDLPYFRSREAAEKRAAESADSLPAKQAHAKLAEHYGDRVWALEKQQHRRSH